MAWVSREYRSRDRPAAPSEHDLARLAAAQHNVVSGSQLRELGFSSWSIQRRVQLGRWHRLFRDVFALGTPLLSAHGRLLAAALACGPHALVSHRAAAHIWGLARFPGIEEVTVGRTVAGPRGVIVHTSRTIHREQRLVLDAVPVTSVNRTLVDLADVVSAPHVLAKAVHEADFLRKLDMAEIFPLLNGRRGSKRLRRALAGHRPADIRSDNEFDAHRAITESALPPAQTNVVVSTAWSDYTVDLLWKAERLIVEIDGGGHRTKRQSEEDAVRDSRLQLVGYRVIRVTKWRLRTQTGEVLSEIRQHLEAGGSR